MLPGSFLSEVDFILKDEKILLSDFHYLDLINETYSELNKIRMELNSLDSLTFNRMIQIISNNKKLQSLNLKLFPSNSENINLNNLNNFANMINTDQLGSTQNNFLNTNFKNESSSKKIKKDVIFDEGAYLLNLILKPFANNLEKLFWNLIERKIYLKFVSINFEMPSYIANEDKYVELFQKNLFLFLEKISAMEPNKNKQVNFNKINMLKNFNESSSRIDEAADKHSIFSDFLRRRSVENTKKKLSFFASNNLNPENYGSKNVGESYDFNYNDGKNNISNTNANGIIKDLILNDSENDAANFHDSNLNGKNIQNETSEFNLQELELNLKKIYQNINNDKNTDNINLENSKINKKSKTIDNNASCESTPKIILSDNIINFDNFLNKTNNKNFIDMKRNTIKEKNNQAVISANNSNYLINSSNNFSQNLNKILTPNLHNSNFNLIPSFSLTTKEKPNYEDNASSSNNHNNKGIYEESVISFEENMNQNKINNEIALQSLEIFAKNFNLDTRKYQIIEKKFNLINLRENNLINLSLDFKFFKFSEKLFNKLIPKKVEDLKLSDLDFDSLKGLKTYFAIRRLNSMISLEVKVSNFFYERQEDLNIIADFLSVYKGDKLQEFVFKTKVNFSDESLLNIISKMDGDYVGNFTLFFLGLKNPFDLDIDNSIENCNNNCNKSLKKYEKLNFDYNKINSIIKSNELKSFHLPVNFREIKAIIIRKMIDSNLNFVMNEICSNSQCLKNTSNTSKSNSNNNYNNEIINYGKDQQAKLLRNIRKVVDNVRSLVKIKQEKVLKFDFI